uniref:Uncharacterized protein n=1 Tax=Nelumbo nucifera TaxID=4432 RepID=A0A822ZPD6_NELNU|nr:TPA_asm: hypothetical protein HUJ06_001888 [Nelumbo nucifera]
MKWSSRTWEIGYSFSVLREKPNG